jgi:hypothetical protein
LTAVTMVRGFSVNCSNYEQSDYVGQAISFHVGREVEGAAVHKVNKLRFRP